MRVPIEIGGYALPTHQVQAGSSVRKRLQRVLAMQHVEKCSSDSDVFIQSRRRNLLRLRLNRKSQAMFGFPFVDRLYKQHSALESSVPHSADSFPGERCLHRVR